MFKNLSLKVIIFGTGGMSHQLQYKRAGLINSEWDRLFWPHAKKGFFKLKKQIETIIKDLKQPSFNF